MMNTPSCQCEYTFMSMFCGDDVSLKLINFYFNVMCLIHHFDAECLVGTCSDGTNTVLSKFQFGIGITKMNNPFRD